MTSLPSFPFVTSDEFSIACQSFYDRVDEYEGDLSSVGWTGIRFHSQSDEAGGLVISKTVDVENEDATFDSSAVAASREEEYGEEEDEDDPEALVRHRPLNRMIEVEYNIMLSPTYQVPVLYFFLRNIPCNGIDGIGAIYDLLIPSQFKSELKEVGVMGGISVANHPATGVPAYFVHPCQTADAMRSIAEDQKPTAETYVLLWLGLVGNCVGLHVPSELVASYIHK